MYTYLVFHTAVTTIASINSKPSTTDSSQTINTGMLRDQSNQNSGRLIYLELDVLKLRYPPFANNMKTMTPLQFHLHVICVTQVERQLQVHQLVC